MRGLKNHVSTDHHMQICGLCVENKHAFPSEQRLYSTTDYDQHLKSGDNDGSLGHPNCEFCRKRYYDSSALFIHLNKDHFACHICERNNIKFKYFKDYKHLETHFRKDHFICEESCCLEKKFVVFENKIDFELHNRQHHPSLQQQTKRSTTLKLDFKISRSSTAKTDDVVLKEDGSHDSGAGDHQTRYEGGMGGRVCDGEWQVELQHTTTDPREAIRASAYAALNDEYRTQPVNTQLAVTMEEFPSLAGDSSVTAAASSGPITIGSKWISVGGSGGGLSSKQRNKKADFPDLPRSDMLKSAHHSAASHQQQRTAANTKSCVSTIEKEYESMGSRSSSLSGGIKGGPDNQIKMVESISGSWGARISVKPQKASKGSSSSSEDAGPSMSYQSASDGGNRNYSLSEARHSASIQSLKAAENSPSSAVHHTSITPPSSSTDDYPQLAPYHSTTTPPVPSLAKKTANSKPIAKAGGWEDALLSVGISSKAANNKVVKSKLSVVKLAKSNNMPTVSTDSSLDLSTAKLIGKLSNDLSEREGAGSGNRKGSAVDSNSSALKSKVKTDNLFTFGNVKLSSSVDSSSDALSRPVSGISRSTVVPSVASNEESMTKTNLKTYGSWVRIGGAGK